MAVDTALLEARKKLEASPNLTDEEYKKKMSHKNDEDAIDNLKFDEKDYDVLDYIVFE
ncbi:MAG: hypothetical protein FWB77_00325 [Treponema sp.]|nr:hypothetical protein [Treponema sp.]